MADVIISRAEAKAQGLQFYFTGKPCKRGHLSKRLVSGFQCCECAATKLDRLTGPRAEAAARGLKTYLPEKPCKRGHLSERYTSSGVCRECQPSFDGTELAAARARGEAKAQGLLYYFTGKPCKHGHMSKRWVRGDGCVECAFAGREKNKESLAQSRKKYAEANVELNKERGRMWRSANRQKSNASSKKWAKAHPERVRARTDAWAKAHPEWVAAKGARRRNRMKGGINYTAKDVEEILRQQKYKCAYCRRSIHKHYHVDHIVSLARGGSNAPQNIQLTCQQCNLAKSAKDPIKFAQELGRLI